MLHLELYTQRFEQILVIRDLNIFLDVSLIVLILNGKRGQLTLSLSLSLSGFLKNVFSKEKVKRCFFVTFNVISRIFPEVFIEISQVVHKIWRFSSSVLAIFINFLDFLTFPCYKESNNVSTK